MYYNRNDEPVEKPSNVLSKQRIAVYGIYIKDNKILLVKPTWNDKWDLPGGGIDKGQTKIQGLKKEFVVETGMEILDFDEKSFLEIETKFYADDLDIYFDSISYFYKINELSKSNSNLMDHEEISEVKYFTLDEIKQIRITDKHMKAINYFFENVLN